MTTTVTFVAACVCGDLVTWTATPTTAVPLCDCTDAPEPEQETAA